MMYVKIHKSQTQEVLAVCDEELLGKRFVEGQVCLEVSRGFYSQRKVNIKELKNLLMEFDNINLVGKKTIKVALKLNIIQKENILKIKGVPHAQVYTL